MDNTDSHGIDDHLQLQKQEVLFRLASLEPRELCNEAITEKCRATRDLRSCGRTVIHSLTTCNHASLCAECIQRCEMCPICRVPIKRDGSSKRLRLYEECVDAGLISAREEDANLRDDHTNADVQHLWLFFDVALNNKLVSLICHYVLDVCMDDRAVSSSAAVSMLLDGTVVIEWCRKTFLQIVRSLQEIYFLGTNAMQNRVGDLEMLGTKLLGLSHVLESLEGPNSDGNSAPLELQQLVEGVGRVSQHLDLMSWCARHRFLENIPSRHSTINEWRNMVHERKAAASHRAWPEYTTNADESVSSNQATLFIEDAISNVGFEDDTDDEFLQENLYLGCLRQETPLGVFRRTDAGVSFGSSALYPPDSVRAAVDMIFLGASADCFLAKKAIFLYYLFDRHWPNCDEEWKQLLDDYMLTFGIPRHAMLESLLFLLLDDSSDMALEEACRIIPEVVSSTIHPKVARVLLERKKPGAALDVLHCSGGDGCLNLSRPGSGDEVPTLADAVTAVRVRLECGLLTEAYLYQRSYISRLKAQIQKDMTHKMKSNTEQNSRDWFSEMQMLVGEICWLCVRKNLVNKMIELPWEGDEEDILLKCLLEQANQKPCSVAGSLMVMYYMMRCRYREVYLVHKKLSTIEKKFIDEINDGEKSELMKSICMQRTSLVEKCIELLPEIQQNQLRTGALDQLLPLLVDGNTGLLRPRNSILNPTHLSDENHNTLDVASLHFNSKGESLLLSHTKLVRPDGWEKSRHLSSTIKKNSPKPSVLDNPTFSGLAPRRDYSELLSSPILGRKLSFNLDNENGLTAKKSAAIVSQDVQGMNGRVSRFLPSDSSLVNPQGINGFSGFSTFEAVRQADDMGMLSNERGQNGAQTKIESNFSSRWVENGTADQSFDFNIRDVVKHRHQRTPAYSSPNGKRKARDPLDSDVSIGLVGDNHSRSFNMKLLPATDEMRHGTPLSQKKNGLRWRSEDDGSESPTFSLAGGRTKSSSTVGKTVTGNRAFRSHVL